MSTEADARILIDRLLEQAGWCITNKAQVSTEEAAADGYDLFILESMRSHGVVQVITDDGDFATVPGIQVFTANRNVIQAARAQGRLITR